MLNKLNIFDTGEGAIIKVLDYRDWHVPMKSVITSLL
jgi:hypothetical protein